jgi:diguanylate cyclase (GGDEF)-like protein/PAS domain S-box-containing protein
MAKVPEQGACPESVCVLLALDIAALGCAVAALGELSLNVLFLRLGLVSQVEVLSSLLLGLVMCGAAMAAVSRLRGIRAWLHDREDRRILAAAAVALLLAGYLSAMLAVAAIGEHERRSVARDVRRSASAIADLVDDAISERMQQARLLATWVAPKLTSPRAADAEQGRRQLGSALSGLGLRQWTLLGPEASQRANAAPRGAPATSLRVAVGPGEQARLRAGGAGSGASLSLRLPLGATSSSERLGLEFPLDIWRIALRLVPRGSVGEVFICPSAQASPSCLSERAGSPAPSSKPSEPRVIEAHAPIGSTGLRLVLRVPARDLYGALLDGERWVGLALPLLAMLGLVALGVQLRPLVRRLHRSEVRLRSAFEESGLGVLMFERGGRIVMANAALSHLLGRSERELLSLRHVADLVHPDEGALARAALADAFAADGGGAYCAQRRYARGDGGFVTVRLHVSPMINHRAQADMAVAFVQDVTGMLEQEHAFRREHAFLLAVLGQMREGVVAIDESGRLRYVNQAATAHLGYAQTRPDVQADWEHAADLYHLDMRVLERAEHPLRRALEGHAVARLELLAGHGRDDSSLLHLQASSEPLRDAAGKAIGAVLITHDVTEVRRSRRRLQWLANHDALTGLPNRHQLVERLRAALERAVGSGSMLAVLFLDLDRFKTINESLGHEAGDSLLVEVSTRLQSVLHAGDTLARLGGDDFVVLLDALADSGAAAQAAERLLGALRAPFQVRGRPVYTGASVGIAVCPADGTEVERLLQRADAALFLAKQASPGSWRYFSETDARAIEDRLAMEGDLRMAVAAGDFTLYYQPKIDVRGGGLRGAEALLRWNRPGHGRVAPNVFIPLLEEMGLVSSVGAWVIDAACAQQARWREQGLEPVPVAVNCSARQFHGSSLVQQVAHALRTHRLDGRLLEVEVTESVLMVEPDRVGGVLRELQRLGVESAIDDFGTGYSSLAYLKRLPVGAVKIDRAFIRNLPGDAEDAAIVQAILALARALRHRVVAEGVESSEQLAFLRAHGCDEYQGFLCTPPLAPDAFARLLRPAGHLA